MLLAPISQPSPMGVEIHHQWLLTAMMIDVMAIQCEARLS
jgi:hypothetical protein